MDLCTRPGLHEERGGADPSSLDAPCVTSGVQVDPVIPRAAYRITGSLPGAADQDDGGAQAAAGLLAPVWSGTGTGSGTPPSARVVDDARGLRVGGGQPAGRRGYCGPTGFRGSEETSGSSGGLRDPVP